MNTQSLRSFKKFSITGPNSYEKCVVLGYFLLIFQIPSYGHIYEALWFLEIFLSANCLKRSKNSHLIFLKVKLGRRKEFLSKMNRLFGNELFLYIIN